VILLNDLSFLFEKYFFQMIFYLIKKVLYTSMAFLTLELSIKSGKDSTSTRSLVINRVRLEKTCKKVH
jgi:hypothetical protein